MNRLMQDHDKYADEIEKIKAMLADNDVVSEMINSHDHSFEVLNSTLEIGLYVHKNDLERAARIIKSAGIE